MSKEIKTYKIQKTIIEKNITVLLNDSLGVVVELEKSEAIKFCELLNVNSDSNCTYKVIK